MKNFFRVMALLLAISMCPKPILAAQSLQLQTVTGQEYNFLLSQIGHLTFTEKNVRIWDKNGNLIGQNKYSSIQQIRFVDEEGGGNTGGGDNGGGNTGGGDEGGGNTGGGDNGGGNTGGGDNGNNDEDALEQVRVSSIAVYPNPTQQVIMVEGVDRGTTMYLFTLSGARVMSVPVTDAATTIDIGTLPDGTYILLVNTQMVKIIKQ